VFIVLLLVASVHHVIVDVNHIATNVHCVHFFFKYYHIFHRDIVSVHCVVGC